MPLESRKTLFAVLSKVLQGHAPKDELERLREAVEQGLSAKVTVILDKAGLVVVLERENT